jgi:hypothetical protein
MSKPGKTNGGNGKSDGNGAEGGTARARHGQDLPRRRAVPRASRAAPSARR